MKLKTLFFPLALIVSLVVIFFLVKPEFDTYRKNQTDLEDLQKKLNLIKEKESNLELIKLNLNKVSVDEKQLLFNAIPDKNNDDEFVAEINSKAKDGGVVITQTSFSESIADKVVCNSNLNQGLLANSATNNGLANKENADCSKLKSRNININISGSYLAIRNFIYSIENMNRLINVSGLDIQKGNVESSDLVAKIDVIAYFKEIEKKKMFDILFSGSDKVSMTLLSGEWQLKPLENYKVKVTKVLAPIVVSNFGGKQDPFAN